MLRPADHPGCGPFAGNGGPAQLRLPARAGLVLLVLLVMAPGARADAGLLSGSLGRWLDTDVLPELGRTLGQHPRFKGETIKLVSLSGGKPSNRASRLHEAVEAHITQRLLKTSGVRIAWSDQPQTGCGIGEQAVYLLGVEIAADGSYYHRLNISMIDVAESVWVSGVSHSWRGRLTATESAALGQVVTSAPLGSVDSPLPVSASRDIAEAMQQHLRCAHPQGLDGPVYLATGASADLNRILASLRVALATTPIAAVTSDAEGAAWVLTIAASNAGTGNQVQQLGLLLTEQSRNATQQVATVYVSGARPARPARPAELVAGYAAADPSDLLSEMRLSPAADGGICDTRKARSNQCAEVSFDLNAPAYLFVLSSSNRRLSTTDCASTLVQASSGERRFRVRVPPSVGGQPDAGVYAIAVSSRSAAKKLSRHIRTGVCSRPLADSRSWLAGLDTLFGDHPGAIQWRAIHLSHAPGGVEQL